MSQSTQFANNNIDFKKIMSDKVEKAILSEKAMSLATKKTVYTFTAS